MLRYLIRRLCLLGKEDVGKINILLIIQKIFPLFKTRILKNIVKNIFYVCKSYVFDNIIPLKRNAIFPSFFYFLPTTILGQNWRWSKLPWLLYSYKPSFLVSIPFLLLSFLPYTIVHILLNIQAIMVALQL